MLGGFGGATKDKHINGRLTNLYLIGGVDCLPGYTPDLKVLGGARIKKTLCVLGSAYLTNVDVAGNVLIHENLTVEGNVVLSSIIVDNIDANILTANSAVISNDLLVCGNTFLKGDLTILGNVDFDCGTLTNVNELDVNVINNGCGANLISIISDMEVYGNASINNDLIVCGDTRIKGNLIVDGNFALSNLLFDVIVANVIVANDLTVSTIDLQCGTLSNVNAMTVNTINAGCGSLDINIASNVNVNCNTISNVSAISVNTINAGCGSQEINLSSNVNVQCHVISNVMAMHVGNLYGKSPINVHDTLHIINTIAGGKITWEAGIEIGNSNTFVIDPNGIAIGKGAKNQGINSIAIGENAGNSGNSTIAIGTNALSTNFNHFDNIAISTNALKSHQSGQHNIAVGYNAMKNQTSGWSNIGIGYKALQDNRDDYNTAIGYLSMSKNKYGNENVAVGAWTLSNIVGDNPPYNYAFGHTAIGYSSMYNTDGYGYSYYNTAVGSKSLYANERGYQHVAIGANAMRRHNSFRPIKSGCVAVGYAALENAVDGAECTAIGNFALRFGNGNYNTAVGSRSQRSQTGTGSRCVSVGWGTTVFGGNNQTSVGYKAMYNSGGIYGSHDNTAIGCFSMTDNPRGLRNTAVGSFALKGQFPVFTPSYSHNNVAMGYEAMINVYKSSNNCAIGYKSGLGLVNNKNNNVLVGTNTNSTNSGTVAIGAFAAATADNAVALGINASASNQNYIQLGQSTNSGTNAKLKFRSQQVSSESWIDGSNVVAFITGTGDIVKGGGSLNTTPLNYIFAYDTSPSQIIASINTLQDVLFDTVSIANGWTHPSASEFQCPATGVYKITATGILGKTTGSLIEASFLLQKNGIEILGSNFGTHMETSSSDHKTVIVDIITNVSQNDLIKLQFAATSTDCRLLKGVGAASPISDTAYCVRINITRLL